MLLNSSAARTDRGELTEHPPRLPAILAHTILLLPTRNASCFGQAFFLQDLLMSEPIFQVTPYSTKLKGMGDGSSGHWARWPRQATAEEEERATDRENMMITVYLKRR